MRFIGALRSDIKFQFKQGFYIVYILLTLIYMLIIMNLPKDINDVVVPLIVFTDPSVVGFFFIGGIIMLEKEQKVLQYLVVTPLRSKEYLLSKVISLTVLGEVAGIAITLVSYNGNVKWSILIIGILLSSIFFTLYGFIATVGCKTINEYFIKMVPYMMFVVLPCFSVLGFKYNFIFYIFPSVAGLKLVMGAFTNIANLEGFLYILFLLIADILLFFKVNNIFNNKIVYGGE